MRNFIIAILLLVSPCLYAQNQPTFEQAWQAAQNGDANAYYWLGCFYYQGEGTKQNYTEALKYFQKAANNGDAYSYAWIAKIYYYGNGCAQNYEEAFKWFLKAANAGQTVVYGWLGSVYYEGKGCNKNYGEAIKWFKKAAENGDTRAYVGLGASYMQLKQYSEALPWLKKAVDNNESLAFFWLGIYYSFVQQNYQESYKWMKKAAESDIHDAYGHLARMYLTGMGTSQNPTAAFKWANKAVENGEIASNTDLGLMYLKGLGTERNEKEALDCFKKAASIGDSVAYSWLGEMYFKGKGTSINEAEGFKWTKKAAETGITGSYIALGDCYEEGKGTEKDFSEAITWYKRAYDKGESNAPMFLCTAYYTQKDYKEAKKWAELTINQKEFAFVGYRILALLNIYGLGVPQNKDKAFELIAKALDGARQKGDSMPNTLDVEGELYLANNNISKAREIYNDILKETPDFYTQKETKLSEFMKEHKGGDVDFYIPIADNVSNHTFAVVISNEKYQMEKPVQYAENDGNTFAEYCKKTLGLPEKNVHFITNATLNNIKHEIKWLEDVIAVYHGDAKVIFYYAGHGIPDEQNKSAYLLPIDGYGSDVTTGYALEDLYKALGSLPSKSVTVFLDACFSGAKRDGDMLASARGVAIKVKQATPVGNIVVFSAAQGDETAYPYKEEEHGLFTYYLLKKLQETKGNVTLGELSDYIKTQVERQSIVINGKLQSPSFVSTATIANSWKKWTLK